MAHRLSSVSRRSFLHLSTAASAAAAFGVITEPMLARAVAKHPAAGAVMIDANENPLGPSAAAREAVIAVTPSGGRYQFNLTDDLTNLFASMNGLKPEYVQFYPGSSPALHHGVVAFTSPTRTYVTADPGYEAGMMTADAIGTRIVKVKPTKTYAHDIKGMLDAAPDAGLFYICTPNNPTGTLTSHEDIEYLLEHKPQGSYVMVDEAYIHFCDAPSVIDLVKADKDVILLRTFSKIYGMAGLRCGIAIARPDLQKKLGDMGGWNAMPVTAVMAAMASLKEPHLVPERKQINATVRQETFEWLDRNSYSYVPSHSNFFMLDTKRPAKETIDAMAKQNVFIGRIWPAWPTYSRITVGTRDEMQAFREAFHKVMTGAVVSKPVTAQVRVRQHLDGIVWG
jgi:histidinol-phosphate aminotransferase